MLTLGPPEAEEQIREQMAIGADRGILIETDGQEWDPQATASAIADAINGGRDGLRPHHHGQRVGRRQWLPSGNPRRARARPPVVTGVKGMTIADGRASFDGR